MKKKAFYEQMTAEQKKEMLAKAQEMSGASKNPNWRPYCLTCTTFDRMNSQPYGFKCRKCGNEIGFDLQRVEESPLNNHTPAPQPQRLKQEDMQPSDIGRPVIYVPGHLNGDIYHADCEAGHIVHWNDAGVMVDYGVGKRQRTSYFDLFFMPANQT